MNKNTFITMASGIFAPENTYEDYKTFGAIYEDFDARGLKIFDVKRFSVNFDMYELFGMRLKRNDFYKSNIRSELNYYPHIDQTKSIYYTIIDNTFITMLVSTE